MSTRHTIPTLAVLFLTSPALAFAPGADLTPEQVREAYRKARPRLEASWKTPATYVFRTTTRRLDIPPDAAKKLPARQETELHVRGGAGRWRFDVIQRVDGTVNEQTVVSAGDRRFQAIRLADAKFQTVQERGQIPAIYDNTEKALAALCRASTRLYNRVDVADILLGDDYTLSVVPGNDDGPVTVAFERKPKPEDANKRQFVYNSGRVTFLPGRDWAIDHFDGATNTGIVVTGTYVYQEVPGIDSRTLTRRVEFSTSRPTSTLKAIDILEAVSITPGPIDDAVFEPNEAPKD